MIIDKSYKKTWNQIREVDPVNLTVTAEREVTFGELEIAVNIYGLHVAAMTDDLCSVTLGDFFAEQMPCLTTAKYNQPRYQILGMEVELSDGTVLPVAGKTVKNVTGYDMCRIYSSSREQLAVSLAFTIKLTSQETMQIVLEGEIRDENVLPELVRSLRQCHRKPLVCVYWNGIAAQQIGREFAQLVLVFSGNEEQVKRDIWEVGKIAERLQIPLVVCEQPKSIWNAIYNLRNVTTWSDGIKVPTLQCDKMLKILAERQIGCWYSPLQGSMQLIVKAPDSMLYEQLCAYAEQLGGCGNWWYQQQFQIAPAEMTKLWNQLKRQFDPAGLLEGTGKGGMTDDNCV